jgi:hypothetical protein
VSGGPLALSLDVSAVPARPAGAGYYTMELARRLRGRADIALTMVSRRGDQQRWVELASGEADLVGAVPDSRPGRLLFEQARFPASSARSGSGSITAPTTRCPSGRRCPAW